MTYRSLHIVALALVSGVTLFAGQQRSLPPRAIITWRVDVEDADQVDDEFTIYRTKPRIVIAATVVNLNESSAVASFDPVAFARHVHITIERGAPIAAAVQWLDLGESTRQLAPGTGVRLRMAIKTMTGEPLAPSRYLLRVSLGAEDLSEIVRAPGTVFSKPVAVTARLLIIDPQTPAERVADYRHAGHAAFRKNQLVEAEQLFRAALNIDADNTGILIELGGVYLGLAKYRDAAACLERVPLGGDGNVTSELLAQAYIGLGDDGRAVQVLTRAGMPNDLIATEIERLKNVVARRQ